MKTNVSSFVFKEGTPMRTWINAYCNLVQQHGKSAGDKYLVRNVPAQCHSQITKIASAILTVRGKPNDG